MADFAVSDEDFVETVRCYPFLYDRTHSQYKNVYKKDETWKTVGSICGITGDEALKRWRTIRDRFQRLHKKYEAQHRSGAPGNIRKPTWPLFDTMRSVLGTRQPSSTVVTNIPSEVQPRSPIFSQGESTLTEEDDLSDIGEDTDVQHDATLDCTEPEASTSKRRLPEEDTTLTAAVRDTIESLRSIHSTDDSPEMLFGLFIGKRIKNLPEDAKLQAYSAIQETLARVEIDARDLM
ncbi:uncharacterized protein LOC135392518 [Ornithodoros turicata]|uniref:uncharacterized protein LOC135392518 n=1 Tax=Ornithodoros turicata TaxID=34597 RepID=UPI00313968EB